MMLYYLSTITSFLGRCFRVANENTTL